MCSPTALWLKKSLCFRQGEHLCNPLLSFYRRACGAFRLASRFLLPELGQWIVSGSIVAGFKYSSCC